MNPLDYAILGVSTGAMMMVALALFERFHGAARQLEFDAWWKKVSVAARIDAIERRKAHAGGAMAGAFGAGLLASFVYGGPLPGLEMMLLAYPYLAVVLRTQRILLISAQAPEALRDREQAANTKNGGPLR
jgi:hypothetical protein